MNWVPQECVPESIRPPYHYDASTLWLLGPDGSPLACVHYEGFNTWSTCLPVFSVDILTKDGWFGQPASWTTDKAEAMSWAEAELAKQGPRQLSMFNTVNS
jgi:hypothetical protein